MTLVQQPLVAMALVTWLFGAALARAQQPIAATYTIRRTGELPELELSLGVTGDADGESQFSVPPEWGGVVHIADHLHELSFATQDGQALAAVHANELGWTVRHAPGAPLIARWKLRNAADPRTRRGNDYRPRVSADFCCVLGSIGLLRPDRLAGEQPQCFRLVFEGFDRPGWQLAHSFGTAADTTVTLPLDTFLHSLFVAGAMRIAERSVHDRRVVFAMHTGPIGISDAEFADTGVRIIAAEREFFHDWEQPCYLVAAIDDGEQENGSLSLGGTALTGSFAMFLPSKIDVARGGDTWNRVFAVLAHEYFHHWNGPGTSEESPPGTSYWFSEGFTEFFTRRLLLRAGLWDARQYLRSLNESIAGYFELPVRHAPNASIPPGFWSNRDLGMLPYRRGDLVALLLDHAIRKTSDGAESLDDLMREVVLRHRRGERAATADLLQVAADFTSPELAEQLRAIVIDGKDIVIDPETFAGIARLVTRRVAGSGASPRDVPAFELLEGIGAEDARARF
ncbi:MAG: hypothetical protein U1E76_06730 [Planctomycetota bacterium]